MPLPSYAPHSHPQPGFPSQHQQQFLADPNYQRPIASLPSHARHMPLPQNASARPQLGVSRPHSAASMLQHRTGSARTPQLTGELPAAFKRPKVIGDGYEAQYLLPGPSNRILLSLKSGLPVQIDWALSRLVLLTANYRDQAARDFTLDSVPGLADALLSYVRRIHAALTGEPACKWAASFFEQPTGALDVGIGAPGDAGHQGTSQVSAALVKAHDASKPTAAYNPTHDPSHAVLMRRALEAALALRNLAAHGSNARSLASVKGIFALVRDILQLPTTALPIRSQQGHTVGDLDAAREDGWLEIEGITELRLYFLDILDALASKVTLTRRVVATAATSTASALTNGHEGAKSTRQVAAPGDDILTSLISLTLSSNDRAFLLGSLRCLTTMASIERNEAAFVEVSLSSGQQSPGLLQRCVELLPLTQDTELLEAVLDMLYQLVCIGNNAIKVAAPPSMASLRSKSTFSASRTDVEVSGASSSQTAHANDAYATAKTSALIRLLSRNLQLGRTMWERLLPLKVPQDWFSSVPSRQAEAMRKQRQLQVSIANETPQERAKRKKLTPQERKSLLRLKEPERGIAWMRMVFTRNPDREITQMEFWTAYKEEFGQNSDGIPLQPAAELIRAVSLVFPQAAAMVVPKQGDLPQRFVIRGIDIKERDIELLEPYRCHWSTCTAPETNSIEAQRSHAKLHVQYASDGRCRWRRCNFDAKISGVASGDEEKRALLSHVLTHIKSDETASASARSESLPKIVVDDGLRVVSGATHTGKAAQFVTAKAANGARVLRGRRDANGVEVSFTMDKAGRGSIKVNGAANGHVAPSNPTPSSGTVDNPGSYVLDVTRTPSAGADESLSPQGPAFTSILILRMLTRRAASLLLKAGSKQSDQTEDEEDVAAIRGQGDEKFGLPLPANFGASDRTKRGEVGDKGAQSGTEAGLPSLLGAEEEDYETTETWAVEAATRLLDAVESVEEDLMQHSSQNDILSSYINETLMELRRRPNNPHVKLSQGPVDPRVLQDAV